MGPPEVLAQSEFIGVCQIWGALELVLIVSPLSELGIVLRLFCWIPYSPRRFLLKIHNFFQPFD